MFGNGKKTGPAGLGETTLVAAGTTLTGDLEFSGHLEIEGTVVGNITSSDEKSRLRILNSGTVHGDISVGTLIINGRVKGNLFAKKLIKLAAKALVEGNLNYKLIEIEKGAEVAGSFVYHQSATNISQFPADSKEYKK